MVGFKEEVILMTGSALTQGWTWEKRVWLRCKRKGRVG